MRQVITDRCKVWEINDKNGTAEVKISSSRKVNENNSYDKVQIENGVAKNGYISDYRSFVRFVGHAYHQLKDIRLETLLLILSLIVVKNHIGVLMRVVSNIQIAKKLLYFHLRNTTQRNTIKALLEI